jgi:hypothetical protein
MYPSPRLYHPDFLWWELLPPSHNLHVRESHRVGCPQWYAIKLQLSCFSVGHFIYLGLKEYSAIVTRDPLSVASSKMELLRTEK